MLSLFRRTSSQPGSAAPADSFLRVVLTLIAAALWLNLLHPLVSETAAWAQKGKPKPAAKNGSSGAAFALVGVNEKKELALSGNRGVDLSAADLETALNYFPQHGWRVHSIVPDVSGSTSGSYNGSGGSGSTGTTFVLVLER